VKRQRRPSLSNRHGLDCELGGRVAGVERENGEELWVTVKIFDELGIWTGR
jgi:hypothetical protein